MNAANRVFICYTTANADRANQLPDLLAPTGYETDLCDAVNIVAGDNDEAIKSDLARRIARAQGVLVLISSGMQGNYWIDWLVETAFKQGQRVVGLCTSGAQNSDIPRSLHDYANSVVPWRVDQIVGALAGEVNDWHCADEEEPPIRDIVRHDCGERPT